MRISIHVAHHAGNEGPHSAVARLEGVVAAADDIGLDTVWVADRVLRPAAAAPHAGPAAADPAGAMPDDGVLEAYTTLGFLAARTERTRLGAMTSADGLRAPGLIVQAAATLDVLSGGRARLGVGPGHAASTSAPDTAARFAQVESLVRLARRMWAGPVLVAGGGEAPMLPLVARFAEACELADGHGSVALLRRKLDILALQCRKLGRSPAAVDVSVRTPFRPEAPADGLLNRCRDLAAAGVDHVALVPDRAWTRAGLKALEAAAPAIHALRTERAAAWRPDGPDAYRASAVGIPV